MRKLMIAGNWKMHGSKESVQTLLSEILADSKDIQADLVVFPPFIFLQQTRELLKGSNVAWGAQTMSEHAQGAYTGEVSGGMLCDFGCQTVLVGHSERRSLYGETDEIVAAKFTAAIQSGLTPIVCVGETLAERKADETEAVINRQLNAILSLEQGVVSLAKALIAYEPVWAIGTGVTATPEQAQAVHKTIRAKIAEHDKNIAESIRILYGGSVKPDNASELFAEDDIDGGLIGGASLKARSFLEIARS